MNKATQVMVGGGERRREKKPTMNNKKRKVRRFHIFVFLFFARDKITKAAQTKNAQEVVGEEEISIWRYFKQDIEQNGGKLTPQFRYTRRECGGGVKFEWWFNNVSIFLRINFFFFCVCVNKTERVTETGKGVGKSNHQEEIFLYTTIW